MKVEVDVLGFPVLIVLMVSVDVKQHLKKKTNTEIRAQEQCESRGGRPGLPAPDRHYGLCGRKKQHLKKKTNTEIRAQEQCESRGGRPGLPAPDRHYGLCGRKKQHLKKENWPTLSCRSEGGERSVERLHGRRPATDSPVVACKRRF